jgi:1-phosphofructokinase
MKRSSPPHIYTITGNLLWEQTLTFADWAPGRGQRAAQESFQVGGKGINVSKMLKRLGAPNTALCFTGGFSGAACAAWLKARKFDFRAFPAAGATRAGMVVRGGAHRETTFLGPDASPGPAAVRACAAYLKTRPDGGVLAICGSLPGWETADFDPLRAALEGWMSRGAIVVDTYGAPLEWFARRPVELVKINRAEFDGLRATRNRWPVRNWVVTSGGGAVALIDEEGKTEALKPPRVREVSATGSGDVLLACMLHARLHRGMSLRASVAFALPYAAANAADPGIAEFPEPKVST